MEDPTSPRIEETSCFPTNPEIYKLGQRKDHVLAHEIGAGSLCRNCDCPGLDLHFWRKMCKICGCRMDEHDVKLPNEYDHAQMVIGRLFGAKEHFESIGFDPHKTLLKRRGTGSQCSVSSTDRHSTTSNPEMIGLGATMMPSTQVTSSLTSPNNHVGTRSDQKISSATLSMTPAITTTAASTVSASPVKTRGNGRVRAIPSAVYDYKMENDKENAVSKFAWVPVPNQKLVEKYMGALPEEERPILGTKGEQNRKSRLQYQLPLYDINVDDARFVAEKDKETLGKFVENVKKNVIGVGTVVDLDEPEKAVEEEPDELSESLKNALGDVHIEKKVKCRQCNEGLKEGEVGVQTDHGNVGETWHPNCFRCAECEQLLVDIIYFFYQDKYYCGRHFADLQYPRCAGCDELIFAKEYTFAEEKSWHFDHFACFKCDFKLGGHRYMMRDEQPHCLDCYMTHFAKTCSACNEKIGPDEKRLNYKESHWHAEESCFHCRQCKMNLIGKRFILKDRDLFCSSECKAKHG